jgi:hypothetical protein
MQHFTACPIVKLLLVCAIIFGLVQTASAVAPDRDGAAIKQDLLVKISELQNLLATPVSPDVKNGLTQAAKMLRDLPPDRFESLDPMLLDRFARLHDLLVAVRGMANSANMSTDVKSAGFPAASYPNIGFDFILEAQVGLPSGQSSGSELGVCTTSTVPNPELRFYLLNANLVGEALRDTARRLCDETIIVLGVGGNLAPVCIVSDIAYQVLRGIHDNVFLCADLMLGAEAKGTYDRLDHVHDDLAAAEQSLSSDILDLRNNLVANANQDEALLHDLIADLQAHDSNLALRIQSILATLEMLDLLVVDFRTEELRIRIECNLADADGKPVGDFMLPSALGGHLETVRAVTAETIQLIVDAGGEVGNAYQLLNRGDRLRIQGDFAKAFDTYASAYRTATR